jgi:hypothetical protein
VAWFCQEMVLTKLCDHKYRYSDLYRKHPF